MATSSASTSDDEAEAREEVDGVGHNLIKSLFVRSRSKGSMSSTSDDEVDGGHSRRLKSLFQWSSRSKQSKDSTEEPEGKRVPKGDEIPQLHAPRSQQALKGILMGSQSIDMDAIEPTLQRAPIHSILTGNRSERNKLLETLLTYGTVDVNLKDLDGNTPLHLAVKNNDIPSAKMLIAFGAKLNIANDDGKTPTEMSKSKRRVFFRTMQSWTGISVDEGEPSAFGFTLVSPSNPDSLDAIDETKDIPSAEELALEKPDSAELIDSGVTNGRVPSPDTSSEEQPSSREEIESEMTQLLKSVGGIIRDDKTQSHSTSEPSTHASPFEEIPYEENSEARKLFMELDDMFKQRAFETRSIGDISEIVASSKQREELAKFKKTGNRILCLDGGGMKALVEIDIMEKIEQQTGKKITELFDWIVGTSTGGILALGLVYAKLSPSELRQLCFRLKDEVFGSPKFGLAYNTEALEEMLISSLGSDTRMGAINHPKVLVAAVHKGSTPLQIHLFNNCFNDDLSNEVVWKVARSTCAGPMLFTEFNKYVDGGVLCNNPTEKGVTAIQNYHWEKGEKLPISLVVSVGSGVDPKERLGSVDFLSGSLSQLKHRVTNLVDLFKTAIGESEIVAETCDRNFKEQNIPYYRFSPQLSETISSGETDTRKLIDTMITTRQQTIKRICELVKAHFCADPAIL